MVFHFPRLANEKLIALSSLKVFTATEFRSNVCSVVKYFYNSPYVFYCTVQSDNRK